jgi:amidohydrolase
MARAVPGCFLRLGVHDPKWGDNHYLVHRADFKIDEGALPIGAAALAATAIHWMENR